MARPKGPGASRDRRALPANGREEIVRCSPLVHRFNSTREPCTWVLGGGGTNKLDNVHNSGTANDTTFTQIRVGTAFDGIAAGTKPLPDASEPCAWSANKDTTDTYGIALFSVNPGTLAKMNDPRSPCNREGAHR